MSGVLCLLMFVSFFVSYFTESMYCVIQFDETGNDSVAVVDQNWLTPLKKEVYWPPLKDTRIFRRALVEHDVVDCEKWKLYGVKKNFFQTDDLDKAFRKEKEAQFSSDINDTDDNAGSGPRKRIRRILEDSDSDVESKYSRPPQIRIKKCSGAIEKRQISPKFSKVQSIIPAVTPPHTLSTGASNTSTPTGAVSPPRTHSNPGFAQTSTADSNLVLVNILNTIKEQNKIILEKVRNIENLIFNQGSQILQTTSNPHKNPLPVDLPLGDKNSLNEVEQFLNSEDDFKRLLNYLGSIGGNNLKSKIHKILRHLLTNELASQFSYFGKRGKAAFSGLCLNKAIIETLQSKIVGASITEIEDTIKTWMKHAPDRMKTKKTLL